MKSVMQLALGADWEALPPALKAHYQFGPNVDVGHLDIEFRWWMTPYLWLLHVFGALVPRSGRQVPTTVEKEFVEGRQYWRRTMSFPDHKLTRFNSVWNWSGENRLVEFVNPFIGLEMAVRVTGGKLHYAGVRFIVRVGRLSFGVPEWLVLGHTTIVEEDVGNGFAMDFRLTHPLFGQVFRYSGKFCTQGVES